MKSQEINVKHAVNKSFLKIAPNRDQMEVFKKNLGELLAKSNDQESEEFHKNLISVFLRDTTLGSKYFMNTKGRNDLVIHTGPDPQAAVGVILEVKKPTNKSEMVKAGNLNVKSFQELVLYYLRERIVLKNFSIRHLIITNVYEWFIFDARVFENEFAQNSKLVSQFNEFHSRRLINTSTDFFYKEIAKPFIDCIEAPVPYVHFDLRDFAQAAGIPGPGIESDSKLLPLFKTLSAEHLLKLPFANDSNSLDRSFYTELLHILGLVETKEGSKRLIGRKSEGMRDTGSLLENTIRQIEDQDKLSNVPNLNQFGANKPERLLNVALELVITWVNRILFLKLLEAQLLSYRGAAAPKAFLNIGSVKNFHDLSILFFQVLAKKPDERTAEVISTYGNIPYLNSSLFEQTDIERQIFSISALPSDKNLLLLSSTVLKGENGRRRTGELNTLAYFFEFLAAYDFSSDGTQEIQSESRALINASVLGLIFEKINGYRDGSFFTPGFVTMYMCRTAIRLAVVNKFNTAKGWECKSIEDLYEKIEGNAQARAEANAIVNSIRICDPAVGSGHFLVSALNELIAVKGELNILSDRNGFLLKEYQVEVVSDELIVTDADGAMLHYSPALKQSQRVQEALFHEKQRLIENCLFGVDINPNSVKICRLRLWIELLKHAYYKGDGNLETLPNIDINIKQGNSLISRFPLDANLVKALKKTKRGINSYREAVATYQNASSKEEKRDMQNIIAEFKSMFRTEILSNDPKIRKQRALEATLKTLVGQDVLFEETAKEKHLRNVALKKLQGEITGLAQAIEAIRTSKMFEGAFEWRFEFPEILSDDGRFLGFDAVIGNPPYGVSIEDPLRTHLSVSLGKVPDFEIYYWFMLLAHAVLNEKGLMSFIVPNSILFNVYAKNFRLALFDSWKINEVLDCTDFAIFNDATVRNVILTLTKGGAGDLLGYRKTSGAKSFENLVDRPVLYADRAAVEANNKNWGLIFRLENDVIDLIQHLKGGVRLEKYYEVSQGYIPYRLSDLVKNFGQDEGKSIVKNKKWHAPNKINSQYKELLYGESLTKFNYEASGEFVWYGKHVASYVDLRFFNRKRLLVREITSPKIIACVVEEEFVNDPQIISVIEKENSPSVEFLWAILNSSLATFYHFNSSPKATKGVFPKILVGDLRDFPMPNNRDLTREGKLVSAVSNLREKKAKYPKISTDDLEMAIDDLVFSLYELNDEQIALVRDYFRDSRTEHTIIGEINANKMSLTAA